MIQKTSLRVTGLASGMNTDEIVTNLVKVQSARLNKLTQNKTLANWKSDAYRDVNKKVDEFRKSMEALRLQSTFNKQTVTSSDSRVEVQMGGTSTLTDFTISDVTLATSAKPAMVSYMSRSAVIEGSDLTFKINGIPADTAGDPPVVNSIKLTVGMTLDEAVAKINEYSTDTKVKASNVGGSLVFTTTSTGNSAKLDVTVTSDNTNGNSLNIVDTKRIGTDPSFGYVTINNKKVEISSNKFTFEGVTFNLKGNIPTGSNVTVQVGSDTQGIFDNIKTFVDKYNELITDFNGRLNEKKYRDYAPLLDEEKKDLKENEIKLWEEKAKSGLLTNDSTIQTFLIEMRNSLGSGIQNAGAGFKTLKEIGINFSTNYRDNGKLVLDEAKLKGVLQTNLEDVKKLFTIKGGDDTSSTTTVTDGTKHESSGFAWRMYDRINVTISQLGSLAGSPNSSVDTKSFMAKQIKALDEGINREQSKVSAYEARLWKQFGAMEKALQQLNSQGSWLTQQLGM
jgi:flagellar hook-associated protein 2